MPWWWKSLERALKNCLITNSKQTVKLRSDSIKFKIYLKQLIPFKIHADFEFNMNEVKSNDGNDNASYTEKYQKYIPCSFAYKVDCIDDKFSKKVVLQRWKNAVNKLLKRFLKNINTANK